MIEHARLIAAAERALRECVSAYSAADRRALMRAFTSDAIIEYALEEPSSYLVIDVMELIAADIGSSMWPRSKMHISNLWITPTKDSNSVFAHYTLTTESLSPADFQESEHLALIQMRGSQIARIRDFNAAAAVASTVCEPAAVKRGRR